MVGRKEYSNFECLSKHRKRGSDFKTDFDDRVTDFAVVAPHDGKIEPHTGAIAKAIAGSKYSYYVFSSLTKFQDGYTDHITSIRFDDPDALSIVSKVNWVLTIHGRADRKEPETVWVGGLDEFRRRLVIDALQKADFCTRKELKVHSGLHEQNICNRGKNKAGVQLEIPKTLRERIKNDKILLGKFAEACRLVEKNEE